MTRPQLSDRPIALADAGLGAVISRVRLLRRPVPVDDCALVERMRFAADIARAVLGELRTAYAEQTSPLLRLYGCAPRYLLGLEDLLFADRWVAYLEARAQLAEWHEVPENRAAAASEAACVASEQVAQLPEEVRGRLSERPKVPPECTLAKHAPQGWPDQLIEWSWALTFDYLLAMRREIAGLTPIERIVGTREPGEDDDAEADSYADVELVDPELAAVMLEPPPRWDDVPHAGET